MTYTITDRVVIITPDLYPKAVEVIDIEMRRDANGTLQRVYLCSDGRHYLESDLFATLSLAKASVEEKCRKVIKRFESV